MNQDLSIVTLVLHASFVVQVVMVGLLIGSLASWTVIFGKLFGLRKVRLANDEFEREFWAGRNLNDLYNDATQKSAGSPMERIFASGMREFFKLREKRVNDTGALLDGARRAMRASFQRELDAIESNLSFLAPVGSVSPYVGLFGTVWGIMHAFIGLSNLQQVTLATVAPGIAEALVTTAIGLFAAIPAGGIDLPSVGKSRQRPEHFVELVIGADEQLRMRVDGKDSATLAPAEVAARALAAQGGNASTPVVISADRGVKYEVVVRTMDALQRAGVKRVGLSVKQGGK